MSQQLANVVATLDDPFLDMYNHVIISMFTMCCREAPRRDKRGSLRRRELTGMSRSRRRFSIKKIRPRSVESLPQEGQKNGKT